MAVSWGLEHRDLEGVRAIGIDEALWHRGYKFLTVVYQIDEGVRRLLWVGEDRKTQDAAQVLPLVRPRAWRPAPVHL